jgi:multiple sugar transport system ATP-binding protein
MPTIILRHVTKRYAAAEHMDLGAFDRMITSTARIIEGGAHEHGDKPHISMEPPGRVSALDNLSLTIRDGETLSVLGPSGCGKTTLLKVIAGLMRPDSGDVFYDSVPLDDIPMSERGIGMVFQNYALYPHLEARDNIVFYDLIHKHPEKIPARIQHIVDVMGVDVKDLLSRKPPTLSGGEQQRVAVGRCLARDPKVFLFDEPLSNLDAKLRVETRVQLHRLLRHYKITSVYVTHDQTEAIALADRIAIMRDGRIEQVGTFQALYETPVNAFVAQFFGSPAMNLFAGHVFNDTWEGNGLSFNPIRPGLKQGQAVWLGIRPEHIELVETGIPATVEFIEPILTQRRQLVYMTVARQPCVASLGIEASIQTGATLQLHFPVEHVYFFDQDTGARIG